MGAQILDQRLTQVIAAARTPAIAFALELLILAKPAQRFVDKMGRHSAEDISPGPAPGERSR